MNATSLYVTTCRYVLRANPEDTNTWNDLYRLLPYLRQALSCCVCTSLISDPMGPTESICQHHVCRSCLGGKMRLRPSCSWCKDYSSFAENKQLALLLPCFKKLCEFIADTPIAQNLATPTNGGFSPLAILHEGMTINDTMPGGSRSTDTIDLASAMSSMTATQHQTKVTTPSEDTVDGMCTDVDQSTGNDVEHCEGDAVEPTVTAETEDAMTSSANTSYSVSLSNSVSTKMKFKRKKKRFEDTAKSSKKRKRLLKHLDPDRPNELKLVVLGRKCKDGVKSRKKGCRCGTCNMNVPPGVFTCHGKRCPCYVSFRGCSHCRCRGCKNPYTPSGDEKTTRRNKQQISATDLEESSADSDLNIDVTDV
ncbi:uncharacterized protein LOC100375676 [Saccoglossus kowalevskii]|uniref:E3 ubiquitin-protein ligase MSL2-like n=1 Tax=Saccoglossus kowalevskii TaxID=10224 RepID=A0ABM0MCF7_SACKO|nr:PREDICTED: E3 ubiquitin-protein ligase MSL2-like [Saccoglossus kowalevskii]